MQTKITFLPDDRARISIEGLHGTNPAACIAWRDFATRGEAEAAFSRVHEAVKSSDWLYSATFSRADRARIAREILFA